MQAFVDKFRFNAKRASLVQSRIKAIERLGETEVIEDDPEYIFKCAAPPSSMSIHPACLSNHQAALLSSRTCSMALWLSPYSCAGLTEN